MTDESDAVVRNGGSIVVPGAVAVLNRAQFLATIAQVAALWTASDVGYYFLLPALGQVANYSAASVAVTLYYAFWAGMAVITFWPLYGQWIRFDNRFGGYIIWSLSFAGCTLFAAYVLPLLPPVDWTEAWNPPEIRVATPEYFLPKSLEILFQQLLILALVLALSARGYSLRRTSITCAAAFGAMHIFLSFGGVPFGYVVRFMVAASLFGFIFPYLLLRVPNGFAFSYMIHWIYYAVSVVLPHVFAAAVK